MAASMQGVSREAYAAVAERFDALTTGGADDLLTLSDELLGVVRLLDREVRLRRALTDPSASGTRKAELVQQVLGSQVGATTVELASEVARQRWSRPRDLADALELLGVTAALAAAERDGVLDDLEDELFRFGRILDAQPELRTALADTTVAAERRVALVRSLLEGKVTAATGRLVDALVTDPRGRSLDRALEEYATEAAKRRERLVAHVEVAAALTDEQKQRLADALTRMYGQGVHLNVEVVPDVLGGVRVRVGDEVVDGSVAARLERARRHVAH